MKKIIPILLVLIISVCVLTGCGEDNSGSQGSAPTNPVTDSTQTQTDDKTDSSENGKTLVAYYSATGYTKSVAETIAETTGGDLFELVPTEIYSSDDLNWRDENSRVSQEYANESLRDISLVTATVENWADYDTVYIGYPIWWGIAAWPVNRFVTENDFSGKTVIPFCTSSSSGLGESGTLLEELAGSGTWLKGQRFRSNVSADDVVEWIKSLNIEN